MKLQNNMYKATPSWKFSTQEGLALVTALSTRWWITKWLKNKKTNKPAYERPITVLFLLQLLLLVKFSLFCVVGVFVGGVMGCGEQVTNWHYFIQSSFALHSLHFELSCISLSISFDCLLYYLFLRQSSTTVHVRRSIHLLLFMISWYTFYSPEGFARNTTSRAWGKWLTSH